MVSSEAACPGDDGRKAVRIPGRVPNGYSDYNKGYEDEVQALQDQARAMERISEDLRELEGATIHRRYGQVG